MALRLPRPAPAHGVCRAGKEKSSERMESDPDYNGREVEQQQLKKKATRSYIQRRGARVTMTVREEIFLKWPTYASRAD